MRLAEKRAVVTGGRQGIGRGIVEAFLDQGAEVITCGRGARPEGLPKGCGWVTADVSDAAQVAHLVSEAGAIDILVKPTGPTAAALAHRLAEH